MKKLVGFITASLPDNNFTIDLAYAMADAGMDILELGIPFSDPVADGTIIEQASLTALKQGFQLNDLFEVTSKIAPNIDTLWMGYMNPYFHYGMEKFLAKGKEFNVQGSIIPDLPHEESVFYKDLFQKYNQTIIDFVAPTDNLKRIQQVTKYSQKFIYLVAYAGITGSGVQEDLTEVIANIRTTTDTPVYIGFGVNEQTAKEKANNVDGVIVGSTFVKHLIDETLSNKEKLDKITQSVRTIKEEINS